MTAGLLAWWADIACLAATTSASAARAIGSESASVPVASAAGSLPPLPPGEEIYDLLPSRVIPLPWMSLLFDTLIVLILVLAGWILLKKIVNQGIETEAVVEPLPPDPLEEAIDRLQQVRTHLAAGILNDKDLCEQLALILKVFAWRRVRAGFGGGSTSDELIDGLHREQIEPALIKDIEQVQNLTDAVKFARGTLGALSPVEMIAGYETLIRRPEWNR